MRLDTLGRMTLADDETAAHQQQTVHVKESGDGDDLCENGHGDGGLYEHESLPDTTLYYHTFNDFNAYDKVSEGLLALDSLACPHPASLFARHPSPARGRGEGGEGCSGAEL
jgi:hypothetical protein